MFHQKTNGPHIRWEATPCNSGLSFFRMYAIAQFSFQVLRPLLVPQPLQCEKDIGAVTWHIDQLQISTCETPLDVTHCCRSLKRIPLECLNASIKSIRDCVKQNFVKLACS